MGESAADPKGGVETEPPLPPLPVLDETPRAVLMMVDPRLLFLYWIADRSLRDKLSEGTSARLCLDVSPDGERFTEIEISEFDFRAPNWYVKNAHGNCCVRVRLGVITGTGFSELLRSNVLRVPRLEAGDEPERWGELPKKPVLVPARHALRPAPVGVPAAPRHLPHVSDQPSPTGGSVGSWQPHGKSLALEERPLLRADGYFSLVLHTHLPFVRHPERRYFMEENWLFEAIVDTYLPLLDMFDHLAEDEVPGRVTLSLTPTLVSMLRDEVLVDKFDHHLERLCHLARREMDRTRNDPDMNPVAGFYKDRFERFRYLFEERHGRDLVGAFADLERRGEVELITCAATHGFLPHLIDSPEAVWAQLQTGIAAHEREIGRAPQGIWLPECAYYEGLDELLARAGIRYFFLDTSALAHASSKPRCGPHAPLFTPGGVAAFARDEEVSAQVWSAQQGYPGDPAYRDFYRDIGFDLDHVYISPFLDPSGIRGMTGFKYHRITGKTDHKEPYRREWALRTLERHADDFVAKRALQIRHLEKNMDRKPLIVAMYDSELFGHWWFEGPEWVERVLRKLPEAGIEPVTPGQYLTREPRGQIARPAASSWGAGFFYEVWLNETNDWAWPHLHDAARRMVKLARRFSDPSPLERRALNQAGRELLLAQSSDWPFILTNRTSTGYAVRRIREHLDRFARLAGRIERSAVDEGELTEMEGRDNLFPDLDYTVWRGA